MKNYIDKAVTEIIETTKYFNWKYNNIWVEDNCIFAETQKPNGKTKIEGLFAGSSTEPNAVYNVFNRLKYVLNFNSMLNDDNIMI